MIPPLNDLLDPVLAVEEGESVWSIVQKLQSADPDGPRRWAWVNAPTGISIITEGDLLRWVATGRPLDEIKVHSVISAPTPHFVAADYTTPAPLLAFLQQHRIRQCPVIDGDGAVIGVITQERILQSCLDSRLRSEEAGQTEQSLRKLNQAIIDAIPDLLICLRSDGTYLTFFSTGAVRVINPEIMARPGATIFEALPPANAQQWIQAIRQTLATQSLQVFEQFFEVFGTPQYEEVRIVPSGPDSVLTIIRDITDRKLSELALRNSEARFQHLAANIPGAIFRYLLRSDGSNSVVYMSPGCKKIWEVEAEAIQKDPKILWDMVHPEDRSGMISSVLDAQHSLKSWTGSWRIMTPSGQIKWLQGSGQAQHLGNGDTCWDSMILDVTEAKLNLQALQEKQTQLDLVVQAAKVGFYVMDLKDETSFSSAIYKAQLGYGPEDPEASPADWSSRLHPEDREESIAAFKAFRLQQAPYNKDFRLRHRDGSYRWIYSNAQIIRDEWGAPIKVIGTHLDITDLKESELTLQQQLEQTRLVTKLTQEIRDSLNLQTIFDTATSGTGKLIGVNHVSISHFLPQHQHWKCLSEYRASPDLPSTLGSIIPDHNNPIASQLKQGKIVQINHTQHIQDPINQALAGHFPGSWLLLPIQLNGTTWGAIAFYQLNPSCDWQDQQIQICSQIVTQLSIALQQTELVQQLQETNDELQYQVEIRNAELETAINFERLLRSINDGVRSTLDEQKILQNSVDLLAEALHLKGCLIALFNSEEEFVVRCQSYNLFPSYIGVGWEVNQDAIPPLSQGHALYLSTTHPLWGCSTDVICPIQNGDKYLGFLRMLRLPQEEFIQAEIRLAKQVANQCAIGIRQARLFQQSQEQVQKLQELNQLKDEFVHMVSHELRTPLTSMKMALTMLEIHQDPSQQQRYRDILKAEWNRELTLVNELLELQALESGTRSPALSCISLSEWIPAILEPFHMRCQDRHQRFERYLSPNLTHITTDQSLLERILLELLNNACKYTPPQELISFSVRSEADWILFQISNTGVTISPEQIPKIFDKFHRITALDRYNQGGTGLGLALVKKAVDLLQGRIQVHSEAEVTRFTVELPSLE